MRIAELCEDTPLRDTDPGVVEWIEAARRRPDADQLYLHGSREEFMEFAQPKLDHGRLIFFTKLVGEHSNDRALQAEYYGHRLYLAKLERGKIFNAYSDPVAKQILTNALKNNDYNREEKIKWGIVDYGDLYEIVPPAVAAGYTRFRVYEISVRGDSHAVTDPKMVTIVDRYHSRRQT